MGGRRAVVVGAGPVGRRRAAALARAGAAVEVVAPTLPGADADALPDGVVLHRRRARDQDLAGAALVVLAMDDPSEADRLHGVARALGVPVNRADDAEVSDVTFPAVVERGPVRVAVSTSAAAPAVASFVARLVEEQLDRTPGLDAATLTDLVELVAEVRGELAEGPPGAQSDVLDWRSALDASILDLITRGRRAEAKERLLACRSSS